MSLRWELQPLPDPPPQMCAHAVLHTHSPPGTRNPRELLKAPDGMPFPTSEDLGLTHLPYTVILNNCQELFPANTLSEVR